MDADVLIDFIKVDRNILRSIVKYVGQVLVLGDTVEKVRDVRSEDELTELGLTVILPDFRDAFAATSMSGRISYDDWLCFLTARRNECRCASNNKHLRSACIREGIPVIWGIELLAMLAESGGISKEKALSTAAAISKINPYITNDILESLAEKLGLRGY